jgi:FtsX-like permease family
MGAAWLWARSDIRRRWLSLVVVGLLGALAVGSVLALVAGARRADRAVDRFLDAADTPELLAFMGNEPSQELVNSLLDDPRIARIERSEVVVIAPAPVVPGESGFTAVSAESSTGGFGRPRLVSGRYPDAGAADEILVNERSASTFALRTGQRVTLRSIACYVGCPPEPIGEATIVGVVRLPTDLIADPSNQGTAIAGPSFLDGRWRAQLPAGSILFVHLHDRRDTAAVVADVSVRIEDGDVTDNLAAFEVAKRATRLQRNALYVAAAVAGVAGLLVVAQALARHLGARGDDPTVLAALGLTRRERWSAAILSVAPGVAGGLVGGVVLAVAASPLLPLGIGRRADPDVGVHVDTLALALGCLGGLVLLVGAAALVAARWVKTSGVAPLTHRPSVATRLASGLDLRPVPATGSRFALEPGDGRGRLPVVPTLVVLVATMAIVVGALVVRWSLDGLTHNGDRYGQAWDLRVGLQEEELRPSGVRLGADPRVAEVAVSREGDVNLVGRDGTTVQVGTTGIEGIDRAPRLTILEGRAPAGPREIALATTTMGAVGLRVGDRTMATGPCGGFEVTVVGRAVVPLTGGADPDDGSILPLRSFEELCAQDLVASLDQNRNAMVRLRDPGVAATVRDEWRGQGMYVNDRATPGSIRSLADIRQVPVIVAAVVGLLGTAAAAHALALAVRRRQRDLAVLRALGLRPRQTTAIVRWQAATLALVAVAIGIPLGITLGRVLWSAIARPSNVVVHTDLNVLGLVVLVAAVAALAVVLSIWPGRRAARLRPATILRSE